MSTIILATGPFFSLNNTNFVVLLGFLVFIGILLYAGVPAKITSMLDARAAKIRADLDEAKTLREEAQTLLASYERKQKEVTDQAASIVAAAKADAQAAAAQAKEDLQDTIARRLKAATDQIASAEQHAVKEVKDKAATVAIAAATKVIAEKLGPAESDAMIDAAIKDVSAKLH
ncbi:F0F1 ATP synthase subunit B [Algicella marina]|uniref:ATP synthase subunit b n=1 Tax=Algicella marina TaxID=2683284 RepID=A0A6P1T2F2_9RHOB|nr:F0F1 ATP synthase subunit B [Algicella marina]QHQ35970.1 F0F1 ATP synthase subunit B [Algicella marina]